MTIGGEPGSAPLDAARSIIARRAVLSAALLSGTGLIRIWPAEAAESRTVELFMTEYRFRPDHLRLQSGIPYRLRLENRGKEVHELTAPQFFASIELEKAEVLSPSGDVVVKPGESKELRFVARRPGDYPMRCADHDWAGMTGEIIVT
jgi:uncharacterized cupredoxin-like copper-binding protein